MKPTVSIQFCHFVSGGCMTEILGGKPTFGLFLRAAGSVSVGHRMTRWNCVLPRGGSTGMLEKGLQMQEAPSVLLGGPLRSMGVR